MMIDEEGNIDLPADLTDEQVQLMVDGMNEAAYASTIFTLMRVLEMIRHISKNGLLENQDAVLQDLVSMIERFRDRAELVFQNKMEWTDVDWN